MEAGGQMEQMMSAVQSMAHGMNQLVARLNGLETQLAANVPLPQTPVMEPRAAPSVASETPREGHYRGTPPIFTGFSEDDVEKWVKKLELTFATYDIYSSLKRISIAGQGCKGEAEIWFNELNDVDRISWAEFVDRICRRFPALDMTLTYRQILIGLKFSPTRDASPAQRREAFQLFVLDFQETKAKARGVTDAEAACYFRNAMPPRVQEAMATLETSASLDRVIQAARSFYQTRSGSFPGYVRQRDHQDGPVPMDLGRMEGRRRDYRNAVCYGCGQPGHLVRNCRAAQSAQPQQNQQNQRQAGNDGQ